MATGQGSWLFVYGTLRPAFDGGMARRLMNEATHVGPAWASGHLYLVADYPAFVPTESDRVAGDLFLLRDPQATLAWLDDYEECAPHHPRPHEYRRERITIEGMEGVEMAWAYIYARPVDRLIRIPGNDFLRG